MSRELPVRAPRGKAFAVAHLSHVVGADVQVRILDERFDLLDAAEKHADRIDWRLSPSVFLVDLKPRGTS